MSQYDPDAPEGSRPRGSQYMSLKDVRVIAAILVVVAFAGYPLYKKMKYEAEVKACKGNIEHVSKAILLYAEQHDMRFPPAFDEDGPGTPRLQEGYPVTWVTRVKPLISQYGNFGCPIANPTELCTNAPPNSNEAPIQSAFGMTAGMVTQPIDLLSAPQGTVFLVESSNYGSMGTYDPVKFMTSTGAPLTNDGFLVGYDNFEGNLRPDATSQLMTRLAFHNSNDNAFSSDKVVPRHDGGLFIIFADGHLGKLDQTEAHVSLLHDEPQGYWRAK